MKYLLAVCSLLLLTSSLHGAPVSKSYWGDKAIGSHDSVAYHSAQVRGKHKAVKGSPVYIVKHSGANWYFASRQSAAKFAENPQQYKPRYNGFCANALSTHEGLIPTDGTVWEFFGDSLHLFYAEKGRQRWLKGDWGSYQKMADSAWHNLQ